MLHSVSFHCRRLAGEKISRCSGTFAFSRRSLHIHGTLGQSQKEKTAEDPSPTAQPPVVGDWAESTQIIDSEAVRAFAELTHDHNAVHKDVNDKNMPSIASDGPIVHGLLAASAIPAVFGASFPGAIYRSQILKFRLPIPIGAAVTTRIVVERVRILRSGEGGAVVRCSTQCFVRDEVAKADLNSIDEGGPLFPAETPVAIEGTAQVLIPSLRL